MVNARANPAQRLYPDLRDAEGVVAPISVVVMVE